MLALDLVPGDRAFILRVTVVDLDQYDRAVPPPMPVRAVGGRDPDRRAAITEIRAVPRMTPSLVIGGQCTAGEAICECRALYQLHDNRARCPRSLQTVHLSDVRVVERRRTSVSRRNRASRSGSLVKESGRIFRASRV